MWEANVKEVPEVTSKSREKSHHWMPLGRHRAGTLEGESQKSCFIKAEGSLRREGKCEERSRT